MSYLMRMIRSSLVAILACAALAFTGGVCLVAQADECDWRNVGGLSFVTPLRHQGSAGTCWAHAAVGVLESKYMITRNDPSFQPDCSEQELVCAGIGSIGGGWAGDAISFCVSIGLVSEAELPYTAASTSPNWPLQSGWQSRVWKGTSRYSIANDIEAMKEALKLYGPFAIGIMTPTAWYSPSGTFSGHAMAVVGFHDDVNAPGGGYWVLKNSYGDTWNGDGYGKIAYAAILPGGAYYNDGITGPVYYTGAMATATWQSATAAESNVWAAGDNTNWISGGSAHTWVNQETAAVFNANANNQIAINGTAIAHSLAFNAGATGYVLLRRFRDRHRRRHCGQ